MALLALASFSGARADELVGKMQKVEWLVGDWSGSSSIPGTEQKKYRASGLVSEGGRLLIWVLKVEEKACSWMP